MLIVLDLTGCTDKYDLHRRIRESFDFPDYYGKNWDAMWDCLTDVFNEETAGEIHIKGLQAMPDDLQDYCRNMQVLFDDLQKEYSGITVRYL